MSLHLHLSIVAASDVSVPAAYPPSAALRPCWSCHRSSKHSRNFCIYCGVPVVAVTVEYPPATFPLQADAEDYPPGLPSETGYFSDDYIRGRSLWERQLPFGIANNPISESSSSHDSAQL